MAPNKKLLILIGFFLLAKICSSQNPSDSSSIIIPAGKEYDRSSFYEMLWGKNNRKDWYKPVKFEVMRLDTALGGLRVVKIGGGHQSKSLQLKDSRDKDYVLRSVNKSLSLLVPKEFHGTFIEHMANDQVSMSQPYGALAIPLMAERAGINHLEPRYYFVPKQSALDTLNKKYGDRLYLFEQRPSGDWSDAPNLGNFKKFTNSEDLLVKINESNERVIDQRSFAKARLFDMLIGDWDRHFDQWKWGSADLPDKKLYVPIPTDRDQAFVRFDGIIQKALLKTMPYMKNFGHTISNVKTFSYERRNLDRFFTNQLSLDEWKAVAVEIQKAITDAVIDSSVRNVPPEIFAISGQDIIERLKSRRKNLHENAEEYYYFLAKEPEVVGSKMNEYFEIKHLGGNKTSVSISRQDDGGTKSDQAYYHRIFDGNETDEIRIFGISGNDVYKVSGDGNGIPIRIIGGEMRDSILNDANAGGRIHLYDNNENYVVGSNFKLHHINDSLSHAYDYESFRFDVKRIQPSVFYNDEDRLFVGLTYNSLIHKWRRFPFASKQSFSVRYSISQQAPSVNYDGLFPFNKGKSGIFLKGYYDAIRWINFFGLGNETPSITKDNKFYRVQSEEWFGSAGIGRVVGKSNFKFSGFFQSV
ncbi:MAG: hypothetical protein ABIQ56_00300, partial [Chitinophagaceae bacterium]